MPKGIYKRTQPVWNKGLPALNKGIPHTKEARKKISVAKKGKPTWNKGKRNIYSKDVLKKMSDAGKKRIGKLSNHWKGGISKNSNYGSIAIQKRRAKLKDVGGSFTVGEWETLKAQYNFTCPCCNKAEPDIKLTIDHIIPITRGGSNYIENIQPLCHSCNSKKRTKIIKYKE